MMNSDIVAKCVLCVILIFCVASLGTDALAERIFRQDAAARESYVTSSYGVQTLAALNFTSNIKKFIEHEEIRLRVIRNFTGHEEEVPFVKKRLSEFKKIYKSLLKNSTAKNALSLKEQHPTTLIAALRNFLATWEDKLANSTIYGARLREFLEINNTRHLPSRRDYNMATRGLSIIQETYNLSISDLRKGHVLGRKGEPLTAADCYDIGKTILEIGLLDSAYGWLEASVSGYNLDKLNTSQITFNLSDALASIARIAFKRKDQAKALKLLEKANELDPDNLPLYQEYVKHRFGRDVDKIPELDRSKVEPWRIKFYSMCLNSTNSTWLKLQRSQQPKLKCRLRMSRSVPYVVYKEEILSKSPYISLILNFLSKEDAKNIANYTLPQLRELVLPGFDPYNMWYYRAGYFMDFRNKLIKKLSLGARELTGLDVSQTSEMEFHGEPAQVVDFGLSGLVLPHEELKMNYGYRYASRNVGKRYATLHVQLTDVAAGGATVFIHQNITILPKKGSAILWYNNKPSGEPEVNLMPATCPLAVGQNIVLEKGIWLDPNDARPYCGRRPKSTHVTADVIQSCHPSLCT